MAINRLGKRMSRRELAEHAIYWQTHARDLARVSMKFRDEIHNGNDDARSFQEDAQIAARTARFYLGQLLHGRF